MLALVLHGDIGAGIRWMEQAIWRREHEGYPPCRLVSNVPVRNLSRNHLWQREAAGKGSCTKLLTLVVLCLRLKSAFLRLWSRFAKTRNLTRTAIISVDAK